MHLECIGNRNQRKRMDKGSFWSFQVNTVFANFEAYTEEKESKTA